MNTEEEGDLFKEWFGAGGGGVIKGFTVGWLCRMEKGVGYAAQKDRAKFFGIQRIRT
jgi:hypothetical protein